jgi:hypothetical protein
MNLFNFFKPSEFATVGHSIKWNDIKKEVLRVIEFDTNGTTIDHNNVVHAKSKFKPYGFLISEWPIIERKVKIPIVHRDDFLLASSVFEKNHLKEQFANYDLLVCYNPSKDSKLAPFLHSLHFVLTSKSTFQEYNEIHKTTLLGCNPELMFGQWVWEGELKVKFNLTPQYL